MNQNLSNQLWLPGSSSDSILLCDTKSTPARGQTPVNSHTLTHTHSLTETHLQRSLPLKWPIGLQWEHRGVDQSEEMLYTHLTFHLPESFSPFFSECFHPWHSYPALVSCFVHLYAWSDRQESEKRVRGAQDIQAGVERKQLHWLKSVLFSRSCERLICRKSLGIS